MQWRRARVGFVVALALAPVLVAGCSLGLSFKCFEGDCTTGTSSTSGSTTGQGGLGGGASQSTSVATSTSVSSASSASSASSTSGAGGSWCPTGMVCVDITSFPFHDAHNTAQEGSTLWNVYSCAPAVSEAGPEIVYRLTLPATGGQLTATLPIASMPAPTDMDIMLLSGLDPNTCVKRDDYQLVNVAASGVMYLVVDTFVAAGSVPHPGYYTLDVNFVPN